MSDPRRDYAAASNAVHHAKLSRTEAERAARRRHEDALSDLRAAQRDQYRAAERALRAELEDLRATQQQQTLDLRRHHAAELEDLPEVRAHAESLAAYHQSLQRVQTSEPPPKKATRSDLMREVRALLDASPLAAETDKQVWDYTLEAAGVTASIHWWAAVIATTPLHAQVLALLDLPPTARTHELAQALRDTPRVLESLLLDAATPSNE